MSDRLTANCPVEDCDGSVVVEWTHHPAERRTHDYPGAPAELEIEVMQSCTQCLTDEYTDAEHNRLKQWVAEEVEQMADWS